jgi:DnaJ-class molecular chaperone
VIRFIIIGSILLCAAIYIRYEFHQVIQQATSTKTQIRPIPIGQPSEPSRTKCLICNGTGRTPDFSYATHTSDRTRICPSCRGTGWIDNPTYGR